jgi:hypothetical protein
MVIRVKSLNKRLREEEVEVYSLTYECNSRRFTWRLVTGSSLLTALTDQSRFTDSGEHSSWSSRNQRDPSLLRMAQGGRCPRSARLQTDARLSAGGMPLNGRLNSLPGPALRLAKAGRMPVERFASYNHVE